MFSGSVSGESRCDLVSKAKDVATAYYGTGCVSVQLREESFDVLDADEVRFFAKFEAQEDHIVTQPAYGPGRCTNCGRESWPHSQLPRARWKT